MNLCERSDTKEYTLSSDELMLKELERRDGIYSFIFQELEMTADEGSGSGSSYVLGKSESNSTNSQLQHNQLIIYLLEKGEYIYSEAPCATTVTSDSPLTSCSNVITYPNASNRNPACFYSESMKTPALWKTWRPPFSSSSCRFLEQHKLFNYVSTGSFQIRKATPRFSHVSVPLARNRRHPLKETPEYKNFTTNGNVPDLRLLFPHDPDVHAPFASVSGMSESHIAVTDNHEPETIL